MSVLEDLQTEAAGSFDFGSPKYEQELRRLKVLRCREMKGLSFCSECPAYWDCIILKQFLIGISSDTGGSDGSPIVR